MQTAFANYNKQDSHYFTYDVTGKVIDVYSDANHTSPIAAYAYDDRGFRVKKTDHQNNTTYYVRNAAGNILAVYNVGPTLYGTPLAELPIYGARRIGVAYKNGNSLTYTYELTDHLGNVRAVVQRKNNTADVTTSADYYPFGWRMPDRVSIGGDRYRFGYQGQFAEYDPETGYNHFEARLLDTRIGRWLATDPAGQFFSPYVSMGNNPVNGVDPDGERASPIFDEDGNFLGTDDQGYKGEIIIMSVEKYLELSDNHTKIIDHKTALKNNLGFSVLGEQYQAISKIQTHVLWQTGFDISRLHNGKTSVFSGFSQGGIMLGYNDPSSPGRYSAKYLDNGKVKVTTNARRKLTELNTVELIASYLGVHELRGHGILGIRGKENHYKVYELQLKHSTYHSLPGWAKREIKHRIHDPENRPSGYKPPSWWKRY